MTLDFTFLKEDQIWGDDALDVMKRYGTKVAPTDLTVILGGWVTGDDDRTSENDLTCASWSASSLGNGDVRCVDWGALRTGMTRVGVLSRHAPLCLHRRHLKSAREKRRLSVVGLPVKSA